MNEPARSPAAVEPFAEAPAEPRPRLPTLLGVGSLRVAPYALGFRALQGGNPARRTFIASPLVPFRILGLLIWGATKDTWITNCQVRLGKEIAASSDPIPALLFASALSFSDLCALLRNEDGSPRPFLPAGSELEPPDTLEGWLSKHPEVGDHQLLQPPALGIGDQVHLELEGPFHQLVFWGMAVVG